MNALELAADKADQQNMGSAALHPPRACAARHAQQDWQEAAVDIKFAASSVRGPAPLVCKRGRSILLKVQNQGCRHRHTNTEVQISTT